MGCSPSTPTASKATNDLIDIATERYKQVEQIKYKLLILGPDESGKSTILKQLRMLHGRQFDQSELLAAKPYIGQNVIKAMRTLAIYSDIYKIWHHDEYLVCGYLRIKCCHNLDFIPTCIEQLCLSFLRNFCSTEIRDRVARMSDKQKFTQKHHEDFARLWNDPRIKNTFESRNKFQLIDSAKYMFDNMHKYWNDEYVPNFEDFTHVYQPTKTVNTVKFVPDCRYGQYAEIYEIFDVGQQKNARRKWMHIFDNIGVIIFVNIVSLSGYNELLCGDNRKNRMREAIELFRGIVNLDVFKDSFFILFLNKSDLFEQKIGKYSVKEHFKDFEGNEVVDEVIQFFKQKFKDQIRNRRDERKKEIYFHVTCATDISCSKKMFECIRKIIYGCGKKELSIQGFL